MPTFRTMRAVCAVAALSFLAACDPTAMGGAPDRATVTVAGRNVTILAPTGFCVDPASTNVSATGAFVMISDCGLLGAAPVAEGDADEPIGAVMTASISAADGPATVAEVQSFAATAQGRAVLSRSGRGDRVRILATRTRRDVLYMLIEDRGPQPIAGIEPAFWRAFLDVQGQMTVLSVLGFEGAGIGPTEGLALIQRFADTVQAANPT
jgi:hypothetical protein